LKFLKSLFVLAILYSQFGVSVAESAKLKALYLCERAYENISNDLVNDLVAENADFFSDFSETFLEELRYENPKLVQTEDEVLAIRMTSEGELDGILNNDLIRWPHCQVILEQEISVDISLGGVKENVDLIILKREFVTTFDNLTIDVDNKPKKAEVTIYPKGFSDSMFRIGKKITHDDVSKFNLYVRYLRPEDGSNPAIIMCYKSCEDELGTFKSDLGFESLTKEINKIKQNLAEGNKGDKSQFSSDAEESQITVEVDDENEITEDNRGENEAPVPLASFLDNELNKFVKTLEELIVELTLEELGVNDGEYKLVDDEIVLIDSGLKEYHIKNMNIENPSRFANLTEELSTKVQNRIGILEKSNLLAIQKAEKTLLNIQNSLIREKKKVEDNEEIANDKFSELEQKNDELKDDIKKYKIEFSNFKKRSYEDSIEELFSFDFLYEGKLLEKNVPKEKFNALFCEMDTTRTFSDNLRMIGDSVGCITFEHDDYEEESRDVEIKEQNGGKSSITVTLIEKEKQYITSLYFIASEDIDPEILKSCVVKVAFERDGKKTDYETLYSYDSRTQGFSEPELKDKFKKEEIFQEGEIKWEGTTLYISPDMNKACRFKNNGPFSLSNHKENNQISIDRVGKLTITDVIIYEDKPILNIFLASHVGLKNDGDAGESTYQRYPFNSLTGFKGKDSGLSQREYFEAFLENFDDEFVRKSLFSKFSKINFLIPQKSSGEGSSDFSWELKLEMNSNSNKGIPDKIIDNWLGLQSNYSEIKVKETEAFKNVENGLAEILIFGQGGLKSSDACHLGQLESIKGNLFLLRTVGPEDRKKIMAADSTGEAVEEVVLPRTFFCNENKRIMLTFPTLKANKVFEEDIQELGNRILTLIVKGK